MVVKKLTVAEARTKADHQRSELIKKGMDAAAANKNLMEKHVQQLKEEKAIQQTKWQNQINAIYLIDKAAEKNNDACKANTKKYDQSKKKVALTQVIDKKLLKSLSEAEEKLKTESVEVE